MIVATAGHVDHGKTLLVKALTGVDTDRLPEEKKRGLTIDLGFAYLPVAPGKTIGFIDVPGHERFIRNMLCGVAGIDFVLLVIAADDGPMPQTREHLAILDLLGVSRGAIVLTKLDRVAPERVAELSAEISALIAGTTLAGAPVFPVSALSGAGMGELKDHLERIARSFAPRDASGNFRLAVDRCFNLVGAGMVVTGTAISGTLAVGAQVRALMAGVTLRVRSIHAQNKQSESCRAGERCALNLAGTELRHAQITRGEWIVTGGVPAPAQRIDARVRVLAGEKQPLANWTPVHIHLGATDVTGHVAVLEGPGIAPGESGLVQLVLERSIGALNGDKLIVRDQSSWRTIGGGRVIDIFPPARGRAKPERLAYLAAMQGDDDQAALARLLDQGAGGLDLSRFAANRNLTSDEAAALFARVPMHRAATDSGVLGFAPAQWNKLRIAIVDALSAWHRRAPDSVGPAEDRILHGSDLRLAGQAVAAVAAELAREGVIVKSGTSVHLPSHNPRLAAADAALWQKIAPLLERKARLPPLVSEIAEAIGEDGKRIEAALQRASRYGLVLRVSQNRFFLPSVARQLAEIAQELARQSGDGRVTVAAFRDRSGIGRNLSIEVLEFFDRMGFTRRAGEARRVLRPASDVFVDLEHASDI